MSSVGLALWVLGYWLAAALAINLAYHRTLTHRALVLWKPLERLLVTAGLPAGTPVQWVANHRRHHAHADREGDPHSPARDGFWWAHVGWYLGTKSRVLCAAYSLAGPARVLLDGWLRPRAPGVARDVAADPYYRFVSRPVPYFVAAVLHVAVTFGLAAWLWGWTGVLAQWGALVLVFNLGDAIDSLGHAPRGEPGADLARDHVALGLLTLGEGWHAGHHRHPWSARHGLGPRQPDGTFAVIRLLERVGLATDVRVASPATDRVPVAS